MAIGEDIKRICGLTLLLTFTLFPVGAGATEASCAGIRVILRDVRVYADEVYVNWAVRSLANPPRRIVRVGLMMGRSPTALKPVKTLISMAHLS